MNFQLDAASFTHPGRIRPINEDSVFSFVRPEGEGDGLGLFIVADGIGGHKAGDVASKIAIESIFEQMRWFLETNEQEETIPTNTNLAQTSNELKAENHLERRLRRAIQMANQTIYNYARKNPDKAGNLGTTVTCALVWHEYLVVANVGDSRAYLFRDNEIEQLTYDHSFVGQLVREGRLNQEAYYTHPRRNVITRALGQRSDIQVDVFTQQIDKGDVFLLCSDGLWEMVRDPEIAKHLHDMENPFLTVQRLVALANAYGGTDNISVVVGKIK